MLNSDSKAASAFTLDSLLKLPQSKAFDKKTSMMQYLVQLIKRNNNNHTYLHTHIHIHIHFGSFLFVQISFHLAFIQIHIHLLMFRQSIMFASAVA